jgi:hypothetical protein
LAVVEERRRRSSRAAVWKGGGVFMVVALLLMVWGGDVMLGSGILEILIKGIHWGGSPSEKAVPTCLECLPAGTRALGP